MVVVASVGIDGSSVGVVETVDKKGDMSITAGGAGTGTKAGVVAETTKAAVRARVGTNKLKQGAN